MPSNPKTKGTNDKKKKTVNKYSGTYANKTNGIANVDGCSLSLTWKPLKSKPAVSPVRALPTGKPIKPNQERPPIGPNIIPALTPPPNPVTKPKTGPPYSATIKVVTREKSKPTCPTRVNPIGISDKTFPKAIITTAKAIFLESIVSTFYRHNKLTYLRVATQKWQYTNAYFKNNPHSLAIQRRNMNLMPPTPAIPIIAVVGSRHSGKTATVETIVHGLVQKGYRVATAKHIHQPDFTIDTKERDTWRHAQAGAQTIIAVATKELTTIKKMNTAKLTLIEIIQDCTDNTDAIVVEGFRELVAQDLTIPKVVTVKNTQEIEEATVTFKPVLAFAGRTSQAEASKLRVPLVDITREPGKLIEIICKRVEPIIRKRRENENSLGIYINGKPLPLNPYVQKVTRNILFGVLSSLKGTSVKGDENVQITITSTNTNH